MLQQRGAREGFSIQKLLFHGCISPPGCSRANRQDMLRSQCSHFAALPVRAALYRYFCLLTP